MEEEEDIEILKKQKEEIEKKILELKQKEREKEKETSENSQYFNNISPPIECAIYVSDIARGVTDEQLKKSFEKIVPVYEACVVKNKHTGQTKGYGFVRFYNMEDTYKALDMPEKPVFEDEISHKKQKVHIQLADPKNTLYIGSLPKHLIQDQIKQIILEQGKLPLLKFELCTNVDGKSKGFGWATYENHEIALEAIQNLSKCEIFGHKLSVSLAPPRVVDSRILEKVNILFVKGITSNTKEEDLRNIFGKGIEKIVIPTDYIKKTRLGHAFIHFSNHELAKSAKERLQGFELEGKELQIEWCIPKHTKPSRSSLHKNKTSPYLTPREDPNSYSSYHHHHSGYYTSGDPYNYKKYNSYHYYHHLSPYYSQQSSSYKRYYPY
jgi:RNA recognition motif-containing protein